MSTLFENYGQLLVLDIKEQISEELEPNKIHDIVNKHLYNSHIINFKSAKFQQYYFSIVNNVDTYLNEPFFKKFRTQYSLQGIDLRFLESLEADKKEILKYILEDQLEELYISKFKKVELKRKDSFIISEQGSFFSKLVHIFRPYEYCALDRPIKKYFGLEKESYFISFLAISRAYKNWANEHTETVTQIKNIFKVIDVNRVMDFNKISDLKLLDLIFWSKANNK